MRKIIHILITLSALLISCAPAATPSTVFTSQREFDFRAGAADMCIHLPKTDTDSNPTYKRDDCIGIVKSMIDDGYYIKYLEAAGNQKRKETFYSGALNLCVYVERPRESCDGFVEGLQVENRFENYLEELDEATEPSSKLFVPAQPIAFVLAGQSNMERNQDRLEARLKLKYGEKTLAIKCAVSGSSINVWRRGQVIYESCVTKTRGLVRHGYKIVTILWFQGETDALAEMPSGEYRTKFFNFVTSFRADTERPGLPIVYAQLGPVHKDTGTWWTGIKDAQKLLDAKPCFYMFETMSISRIPDNLHYDEIGYNKITDKFMGAIQGFYP